MELKIKISEKQINRFWSKVNKTESCWLWLESKSDRYGRFKLREKNLLAHRVSYELSVGQIPKGLQIDHLCRNTKCVNPEHLEPVTCRENIMRGDGLAASNAKKETCKCGNKFDKIYQGRRCCSKCKARISTNSWRKRNGKLETKS